MIENGKENYSKYIQIMENKLDVLTKKLYEEGVGKANQEAEKIIAEAKAKAECLISEAEAKAKDIQKEAMDEAENLKKKAASEMALSARQAITALKQEITGLIAGKVSGEMAKEAFKDVAFVQEMVVDIIKKWSVASGNLNLEVILSDNDKAQFQQYVLAKYKELLDQGLEVKAGGSEGTFILRPKDGGYQVAFSEELFESFFNQYMRSFTKSLLYK